jgi:hypothetical protein
VFQGGWVIRSLWTRKMSRRDYARALPNCRPKLGLEVEGEVESGIGSSASTNSGYAAEIAECFRAHPWDSESRLWGSGSHKTLCRTRT